MCTEARMDHRWEHVTDGARGYERATTKAQISSAATHRATR
jgi:hypothetical protein